MTLLAGFDMLLVGAASGRVFGAARALVALLACFHVLFVRAAAGRSL
jgi:hypothetical protein